MSFIQQQEMLPAQRTARGFSFLPDTDGFQGGNASTVELRSFQLLDNDSQETIKPSSAVSRTPSSVTPASIADVGDTEEADGFAPMTPGEDAVVGWFKN
jgi:hypothetical protein